MSGCQATERELWLVALKVLQEIAAGTVHCGRVAGMAIESGEAKKVGSGWDWISGVSITLFRLSDAISSLCELNTKGSVGKMK